MEKLRLFNKWYDSLPEPRRFLTFIIPMAIVIVLINIKATMLIGIMGFSLIGLIAATRAARLSGGHVIVAIALGMTMSFLFLGSIFLLVFGQH